MNEGQSDEVCFGNEPEGQTPVELPVGKAQWREVAQPTPPIVVSQAPYEFWGGPRSVAVIGPNEYWEGWFHGFGLVADYENNVLVQRSYAFIEGRFGSISLIDPTWIKFIKPMGQVQRGGSR